MEKRRPNLTSRRTAGLTTFSADVLGRTEELDAALKANDFVVAESVADKILLLISSK